MSRLTPLISQPRAFAYAELVRAAGRRAVEASLASRELVKVTRGLYASSTFAGSPWVAAAAVCRESSGALTGRAALAAWGAVLDAPAAFTVVMPAARHLRRTFPDVRLLRTRHDVPVSDLRGMPVAEPEWALVHAMREVGERDALAVALEALGSGTVLPLVLTDLLETLPRAPRRPVLREALASHADGARSILEHVALRDVLVGPPFDELRWQWPIRARTRRFVLDAFHARAMVAFELDGARFHMSPDRWAADRERDALLAARGIQTVRFTFADVTRRPEWCADVARAVIAGRVWGEWHEPLVA